MSSLFLLAAAAAASLVLPSLAHGQEVSNSSSFEDMIAQTSEWNSNFNWTTCTDYPDLDTSVPYSCANFTIPLDWADSSVGKGSLALVRIAAADQENKKGSIFINPGGPGQSGRALVASVYGPTLFNTTGGGYDVIGWDPRGVGAATVPGISTCFETEAEYIQYFNGTAQGVAFDYSGNFSDPTEIENYYSLAGPTEEAYKGLKEICDATASGPYFQYIGTVATVRDVVAMTEFFEGKDADVNFWGFSYGTLLGQTLVNMFPDRVGRIILDGVVDAELYWTESHLQWREMVVDTDETYEGFATACLEVGPEQCAIANENVLGGMDVVSWTRNLTDWLHEEGNVGWVLRLELLTALYDPYSWGTFSSDKLLYYHTLTANGTVAQLAQVAEQNGTSVYSILSGDLTAYPHTDALIAIEAGDAHDPLEDLTALDLFEERVSTSADVSGYFGMSYLFARHITHLWPYRAVERFTGPFNSTLKNKILVATNTWDPVTPKSLARKAADLLGASAEYVEQKGYGHSTLSSRSQCMSAVYLAYWNDGTTPSGGTTLCEVDDTSDDYFASTNTTSTDGAVQSGVEEDIDASVTFDVSFRLLIPSSALIATILLFI